jgi:hypothetical protein
MSRPFDPIYGPKVIEDTGCSPEQTHTILDIMRDRFGTLDHLNRKEFRAEARAAWRCLVPAVGSRVQLHPGTDQWMMGDRFGEVRKVDTKTGLIHVKMDRSGKTLKCKPEHILPRNPETDNRLEP